MKFKSIVIFMRPGEATVVGSWVLNEVVEFAEAIGTKVSYYTNGEDVHKYAGSLFVSIGGDGTMLRTMDLAIQASTGRIAGFPSVVGFNGGTLGFLTEDPNRGAPTWLLDQIYNDTDAVRQEKRLALSTTIDGKEHFALNEFTFTPKNVSEPLTYQIHINGGFVAEHMGSGCLVATPTGSTAMSMSAGGAIIVPSADVMQVVPIIPHTLTSRPIVTSSTDEIFLSSDMDRIDEVIVSSDGREIGSFTDEAVLKIKKAELPVRVWYRSDREFFNVLSTKLRW